MNERREQTMPGTIAEDADRDRTAGEAVVGTPARAARPDRGTTETPGATGGVSTADMAAAMTQRGTGGTGAAAAAMERRPDDAGGMAPTDAATPAAPLFSRDEAEPFRSRWLSIQAGFVDEPRKAVEQADALVAEVIQRLAQVFAAERSTLEQQWGTGAEVDTEGLRVALRRYRSFFERLLSA